MASAVAGGASPDQLVVILRQFKDKGLTVEEALRDLGVLRTEMLTTDDEDLVLDAMDFASGWCSPHMKVW
jgi:uncharacterized protein YgfB (UPF0149 family)